MLRTRTYKKERYPMTLDNLVLFFATAFGLACCALVISASFTAGGAAIGLPSILFVAPVAFIALLPALCAIENIRG